MKATRIIAVILASVGLALILACSEQKTAWIEGNEDIVAVMQKLPGCYKNPETVMEIYTEDAVFMHQDATTRVWNEFKGLKQIENYKKERGKSIGIRKLSLGIYSIKKEADTAQVEYHFISKGAQDQSSDWQQRCLAELVKDGSGWKIRLDRARW